jgi:VanZ family protein
MLVPAPPPAVDTGWDKANHLLAFAGPMFAGCAAGWPARRLAAALLAYGGAIELLQTRLPPRSGDWADWLADAAGIALGALLARAWAGLLRARGRRSG